MDEKKRTYLKPPDGMPTDRLWSWEFGFADWIMMAFSSLLFIAFVTLLLCSPAIVERSRMMPSAPLFGVLVTFAGMIFRPSSNTTRIPAVYLMLLSLVAIFVNWSLL